MSPKTAIKAVIFDADDTLWECARFYDQTVDRFVCLMADFGYQREQVSVWIKERDQARFNEHKFGALYFNQSLQALFSEKIPHPGAASLDTLNAILYEHYNHPLILLPGVEKVLQTLRQSNLKLYICTKGEVEHQTLKIKRSGLTGLLDAFSVVQVKNESTFSNLFRSWGLKENETLVVGDNYHDDILPPINIGAFAAYIPHPRTLRRLGNGFVPIPSRQLLLLKSITELEVLK